MTKKGNSLFLKAPEMAKDKAEPAKLEILIWLLGNRMD
jgi:hypothetical protein